MSPSSSRPDSVSTVSSVILPAGRLTPTARGLSHMGALSLLAPVPARLREPDGAERGGVAGDGDILRRLARDRQEDALLGAALIGLAGRVEEARAEAGDRGDCLGVAHIDAHRLDRRLVIGVALDVSE